MYTYVHTYTYLHIYICTETSRKKLYSLEEISSKYFHPILKVHEIFLLIKTALVKSKSFHFFKYVCFSFL